MVCIICLASFKRILFYFVDPNNQSLYKPKLCTLEVQTESDKKRKIITGIIRFIISQSNIIYFALDFVLLFIKSDQDVLQGVSKLDNILKVSAVQRYKINKG